MIKKLDGADVLMLSKRGHYGYIKISDSDDSGIEIKHLAICSYANNKAIYLFLCDENMSVEQDIDFCSVEEAIANAQGRSSIAVIWMHSTL